MFSINKQQIKPQPATIWQLIMRKDSQNGCRHYWELHFYELSTRFQIPDSGMAADLCELEVEVEFENEFDIALVHQNKLCLQCICSKMRIWFMTNN